MAKQVQVMFPELRVGTLATFPYELQRKECKGFIRACGNKQLHMPELGLSMNPEKSWVGLHKVSVNLDAIMAGKSRSMTASMQKT